MTAMERLVAAINGTPADRIPVFCNLLDQGSKELGMSSREYYTHGEHVAEGQIKMREKYGYDNLVCLFHVGKEVEILGCRKVIFADDGPPTMVPVIKNYDDIAKIQVPDDIASHPALAEELKCLRILKAESGGKYPIGVILPSSMTLPSLLMGMEKWMQLLLMGPSGPRDELLSKCSDFFHKEIAVYRKAGADYIVYSHPFGSTDFVPRKFFNEVSLPWMEKDLGPVGTAGVGYFSASARINDVIETVIDRFGISSFYLSPLDDIAEAKRLVAGRGLTCGLINDIKLVDWSRDQIRAEVKRMIDAGKPGGKFLFGTLIMPYAIPEENIHTMIDAACEFGKWETS